jgi:hypothetical protein
MWQESLYSCLPGYWKYLLNRLFRPKAGIKSLKSEENQLLNFVNKLVAPIVDTFRTELGGAGNKLYRLPLH